VLLAFAAFPMAVDEAPPEELLRPIATDPNPPDVAPVPRKLPSPPPIATL